MNYDYSEANWTDYDPCSNNNTDSYDDDVDYTNLLYYSEDLIAFKNGYQEIHAYLSLTLCILGICGIFANFFNTILLLRHHVFTSTYAIMTGIAVSDMIVVISYLADTLHSHFMGLETGRQSYGWQLYLLVCAHCLPTFNTCSNWLTVVLATWRLVAVRFPTQSKRWCTTSFAVQIIATVYIGSVAVWLPKYFRYNIVSVDNTFCECLAGQLVCTGDNKTVYYGWGFTNFGMVHINVLREIEYFTRIVVIRLAPCLLLCFLTLAMVLALYRAMVIRRSLTQGLTKESSTKSSTRLVHAVMGLFLITEIPEAVLQMITLALGKDFYNNVYDKLFKPFELLSFSNNALNFLLFCVLSHNFRDTFSRVFLKSWVHEFKVPSRK